MKGAAATPRVYGARRAVGLSLLLHSDGRILRAARHLSPVPQGVICGGYSSLKLAPAAARRRGILSRRTA